MLGQSTPDSPSIQEHRDQAASSIGCAVVTISDTRTIQTDKSGALVAELLTNAGHRVLDRTIVPDEPEQIRTVVARYVAQEQVQAVLLTGGTGISPRDQTFETISAMLSKALPGYGELFRTLSYMDIGPAAMLSRAVGGLIGDKIVLTMPGSSAAVRLAMERLILPELGHLIGEATKR